MYTKTYWCKSWAFIHSVVPFISFITILIIFQVFTFAYTTSTSSEQLKIETDTVTTIWKDGACCIPKPNGSGGKLHSQTQWKGERLHKPNHTGCKQKRIKPVGIK